MPRYVILCQSGATAAALKSWRDLLGGEDTYGKAATPAPIIFDPGSFLGERSAIAYETLVDRIETAMGPSESASMLLGVVVMVDSVRPTSLSAISGSATWDHLIALLVLTFPDIWWVFGVIQGDTGPEVDKQGPGGQTQELLFPFEDHSLLSLLTKPGRPALLDGTGLREWVKSRTNAELRGLLQPTTEAAAEYSALKLPARSRRAASIDEEAEFAFMHAYSAYRYGFRGDVITSWRLMEHIFANVTSKGSSHGYSIILEDMRLQFSDKSENIHLSRLEAFETIDGNMSGRAHHCPLLGEEQDNSDYRFLITTGQIGKDRELIRENEWYLERKELCGRGRGAVLYKPVGGILDLWDKTELTKDLNRGGRPGNAEGFFWPPAFREEGPTYGHGAPGKLALVATTLLQRATQLRNGAATVVDFIRGAVFSVEATELLGGKTPNLTLAALALKHEFEVRAECAFVGAGYHFTLKRRLKELEEEVRAVTQWFHEVDRKRIDWDARTSILSRLVRVFREAGQLEEEHVCLVSLRKLNRKLNRPGKLHRFNPLAWLSHGTLSYGEWLLASFSNIVLVTALWIVLLVAAVLSLGEDPFSNPVYATAKVINWMVGGNTESGTEFSWEVLSWVAAVSGVFHLGILISYFYSLIARK